MKKNKKFIEIHILVLGQSWAKLNLKWIFYKVQGVKEMASDTWKDLTFLSSLSMYVGMLLWNFQTNQNDL